MKERRKWAKIGRSNPLQLQKKRKKSQKSGHKKEKNKTSQNSCCCWKWRSVLKKRTHSKNWEGSIHDQLKATRQHQNINSPVERASTWTRWSWSAAEWPPPCTATGRAHSQCRTAPRDFESVGHLKEGKRKDIKIETLVMLSNLKEKTKEKRGKKTQIKINSEAIKQSLEGKKKKRKKSIV